ncbi:MAG TPA: leucyl aminopeptidase [Hypericibacter adhaerens]|jgi:leucyl aminopeptidase|uniref:Probable cytosol aminopeptidase n=1 Tax=Hypericibacter adhaerens TaxID=2602016 RepID=A0A5J6N2D0_9PROT|nr:leucyl aminopeptidase [Hypericibacter adhaerens]QEX23145.1 putative cytosol aminopeptidase [Hypericibacter adhaerens]HWA45043.1 leucyl aminopeptidase [Hypericibacter adhaerens]
MKIHFAKFELPDSGALAVGALDERKLQASATAVDKAAKGALGRALAVSRFKGRADDLLQVLAPGELALSRVLLFGLGQPNMVDVLAAQAIGGRLIAHVNATGDSALAIAVDAIPGAPLSPAEMAAQIAFGARLRSYRFDKYRTKEKPEQKPSLKKLTLLVEDPGAAKKLFEPLERLAEGVAFTRDLVSEPANIIYPESLAEQTKTLEDLGVKVEILGEKEMKKLGMGALLGVGQGSARESQLVVMQWKGLPDSRKKPPVAFVGKGVTFDTGGISIKPAAGMEEMKWDMAGAGAVIGLMKALAGRKAKVNAVGVVGLVENMPSGTAQRPGDVVKSMSGQTIEVINTDAEGRLVLADAIWYTQDRFKPQFVVNLATLTGAIMIALGQIHAGLFSNNDQLAERLLAAGRASGEPLWRMPLGEGYDKIINSDIADMKNVGNRYGGSITAAQFIQRFVNGVPWAHLDIAGMAWSDKDAPTVPKGATGYGVRLLERFVADHYEER